MASITTTGGNAAARVFAIPELLENILINLSPGELYQAQIIDKTFKATISGSPQLQKMMHLEQLDGAGMRALLRDERIVEATYPFIVDPKPYQVLNVDYLQEKFGENFNRADKLIAIYIEYDDTDDEDYYLWKIRKDTASSWRKIKVGTPGQKICVTLDYWDLQNQYLVREGGGNYGDLIDACLEKVRPRRWWY